MALCRHLLDSYSADLGFIIRVIGSSKRDIDISAINCLYIILGCHILPLQSLRGYREGDSASSSWFSLSAGIPQWWSKVEPRSKADLLLQQTHYPGIGERFIVIVTCILFVSKGGAGSLFIEGWTEFDSSKLRLATDILSHCATFLRTLSAFSVRSRNLGSSLGLMDGSNGNVIVAQAYIDFETVSAAFCSVSALVELIQLSEKSAAVSLSSSTLTSTSSGSLTLQSGLQWLASPLTSLPTSLRSGQHSVTDSQQTKIGHKQRNKPLLDSLIFTAENLISVAQDLSLAAAAEAGGLGSAVSAAASLDSLRRWQAAADKLCSAAHAVYPAHSFASQTARWVADNFDSLQMR